MRKIYLPLGLLFIRGGATLKDLPWIFPTTGGLVFITADFTGGFDDDLRVLLSEESSSFFPSLLDSSPDELSSSSFCSSVGFCALIFSSSVIAVL